VPREPAKRRTKPGQCNGELAAQGADPGQQQRDPGRPVRGAVAARLSWHRNLGRAANGLLDKCRSRAVTSRQRLAFCASSQPNRGRWRAAVARGAADASERTRRPARHRPARSSRKPVRRHEVARHLGDPRRHNPADGQPIFHCRKGGGQRPAAQSKAGIARLRTGASDNRRAMANVGGGDRSGPPGLRPALAL
jgi:hypothetical protein